MQFLIITGMSGAGKSRAADVLEDLDFYCVDNMPAELMPMFARLCMATKGRYEKVALVTDVREKNGFGELLHILDGFDELEFDYKILYMDADVRTLVRRYKETRRPHPLAQDGESLESSIRREEKLLEPIKKRSDYIIDTGSLTLGMLQNRLYSIFAEDGQKKSVTVNVVSFGYKFGIPTDADLVFDVRFLPNPFYVDDLRTMSGEGLYLQFQLRRRLFEDALRNGGLSPPAVCGRRKAQSQYCSRLYWREAPKRCSCWRSLRSSEKIRCQSHIY